MIHAPRDCVLLVLLSAAAKLLLVDDDIDNNEVGMMMPDAAEMVSAASDGVGIWMAGVREKADSISAV